MNMVTGFIRAVHTSRFTCDVVTEDNAFIPEVPILTLYQTREYRAGIFYMPRVNDECYVVTDDHGGKRILGFMAAPGTDAQSDVPSYGQGKPTLLPGDMALCTENGATVLLRTNGVLELGTKSARTFYMPLDSLIRTLFFNNEGISPLGGWSWTHSPLLTDGAFDKDSQDAPIHGVLKINVASNTKQSAPHAVELRFGHVQEGSIDTASDGNHLFAALSRGTYSSFSKERGLLSAVLFDGETKEAVSSLQMNELGDVLVYGRTLVLEGSGSLHAKYDESIVLRGGKSKLQLDGNAELSSPNKTEVSGVNVVVRASSSIELVVGGASIKITPGGILLSGDVKLGSDAAFDPIVTASEVNTVLKTPIPVMSAGTLIGTGVIPGQILGTNKAKA